MRGYKTEAVVLKRMNLGEADRLVTIFSRDCGKLQVLAKGVRRINSKRAPHIEIFNQVKLGLHKGKTFELLIEAEVVESFEALRRDLKKVGAAYCVCELVDSLTREGQKNDKVYYLLIDFLKKLTVMEKSQLGFERELNGFSLELLRILGFWPKDRDFVGETQGFVEDLINRKLKSRKILERVN